MFKSWYLLFSSNGLMFQNLQYQKNINHDSLGATLILLIINANPIDNQR